LTDSPATRDRQAGSTRNHDCPWSLGLIGDEAFLVSLFPLPAQRVGTGGDASVGVLRVGDVRGFGALQKADVLTARAGGSEERSAWPPGEQPVLVTAAHLSARPGAPGETAT